MIDIYGVNPMNLYTVQYANIGIKHEVAAIAMESWSCRLDWEINFIQKLKLSCAIGTLERN